MPDFSHRVEYNSRAINEKQFGKAVNTIKTTSNKDSDHEIAPEDRKVEQEQVVPEVGGREGLEPTRYGDWEKNGRCIDF